MRFHVLMALAWLPITTTGCGAPPPGTEDPARCVVGVWESPPLSCRTVCPGRPQCDAADCSLRDLMVLLEGGGGVSVRVSLSLSQRSLTGGPRSDVAWSVDGERLVLDGKAEDKWQCSTTSLSFGFQTISRSDSSVATAVLGAIRSNEWDHVPLE